MGEAAAVVEGPVVNDIEMIGMILEEEEIEITEDVVTVALEVLVVVVMKDVALIGMIVEIVIEKDHVKEEQEEYLVVLVLVPVIGVVPIVMPIILPDVTNALNAKDQNQIVATK